MKAKWTGAKMTDNRLWYSVKVYERTEVFHALLRGYASVREYETKEQAERRLSREFRTPADKLTIEVI